MVSRVELKTQAKCQMKGNIGKLFVCILIVELINVACSFIPVVGQLAVIVVNGPFELGLMMIYLNLTEGKEVKVENLFKGFDNFGTSVILSILRSVFIFLWTLLLIVPGIIKTFSYSMCMLVLGEHPEYTATQALRESERIMDGHKMDLFVLELSFIPWLLLVAVTCGLAAIYVAPYMQATITDFYNSIKNEA